MKRLILAGLCLVVLVACAVIFTEPGLAAGFLQMAGHPPAIATFAAGFAPALRGSTSILALRGGIASVRSEGDAATLVKNLITELEGRLDKKFDEQNKAFDSFKAENNAAKDGLDKAKVDKINNEISSLGDEMATITKQLAALRLGSGDDVAGGAPRSSVTPEEKAYRQAFSGRGGYLRRGADSGLADLAVKASLSSDSNPDGGYTVAPEIDYAISRVQAAVSSMRGLAQVISIGSASHKKLVSQGGATGGWVGQRQARTETTAPNLAALDFPAMELYAEPAATQTLLDDSVVNIEQWLADEVGITFNEMEGAAFISGTGVNQPKGFLAYTAVADASYAWGSLGFFVSGAAADFATATATVNPADALLDLCYGLKQGYRANGTWMMNRLTQGKVRKFKDQNGNYIWQPAMTAGQPATLFSYPVADDDNMPNVAANAFPVAFGDFRRGYMIVDRVGVRVLRDPLTNKPYALFYTTKRVGGGVQNFEAIKLLKMST